MTKIHDDIKRGDVVLLNSDDTMRMSVHETDEDMATCQWMVGGKVKKERFYLSQLRPDTKRLPDAELDKMIIQGFTKMHAIDLKAGLQALSITELHTVVEFANRLLIAATAEIEAKSG